MLVREMTIGDMGPFMLAQPLGDNAAICIEDGLAKVFIRPADDMPAIQRAVRANSDDIDKVQYYDATAYLAVPFED